MRLCTKAFMMAMVLAVSLSLFAQEAKLPNGPDLLIRLSYDNGAAGAARQTDGVRHVCLTVFRNGDYAMIRNLEGWPLQRLQGLMSPEQFQELQSLLTKQGPLSREQFQQVQSLLNQHLQGTMSAEQLQQLQSLLESSDFRTLSGKHGALIRESAETFAAEIPKAGEEVVDGTFLVEWLNADGESPFPASVTKVVDWLNHFKPSDAKPLARSEFQDVCPSAGMRFLQPSVAANVP
jgi:hypothetical protein